MWDVWNMNRCAQTVVPSRDWEDGGGSDRFLDEGGLSGPGLWGLLPRVAHLCARHVGSAITQVWSAQPVFKARGTWLASEDCGGPGFWTPRRLRAVWKWPLVERAVCILYIPRNLSFRCGLSGAFFLKKPFWSKWFLIEMLLSLSCKLGKVCSVDENNTEIDVSGFKTSARNYS